MRRMMSTSSAASSPSRSPHVVVFGASGYVGSAICQEALRRSCRVTGVSRNGDAVLRAAPATSTRWHERVEWLRGDALDPSDPAWTSYLRDHADDIDAVVCSIGGFGSVAWMERINGVANMNVFQAVHALRRERPQSPTRVGFVSAHQYCVPQVLQAGYFRGKRQAEAMLREQFGPAVESGQPGTPSSSASQPNALPPAAVIVQPSFVYGERYIPQWKRSLPLQWIGAPMSAVFRQAPFQAINGLPVLDLVFTPPVSVRAVASSLLSRLLDPALPTGTHIVTVQDMLRDEQFQQ